MAIPVLMYGCECLVLTAQVLQQTQLAQMNVGIRRLTLRNYLTNASVKENKDKCFKERILDYRNKRRKCLEHNDRNETTKGSP
jgi:hypothetical protein